MIPSQLLNQSPRTKSRKKKKSSSEEPGETLIACRRLKKNFDMVISFSCKSPATPYFPRPFDLELPVIFSIPKEKELELRPQKRIILPCTLSRFPETYKKFIQTADLLMGHKPKKEKNKVKKTSSKEDKFSNLHTYFEAGISDIKYLSKMTKLSKPTIKHSLKKYQKNQSLLQDYRGKPKALSEEHTNFIVEYFSAKTNFNKTVLDLHEDMIKHFNLEDKPFSFWILYDYLEELKFTYKNILYKNLNANTPKVKEARQKVALQILGAHYQSLDFIYLDETSFNLETWSLKGWAPSGQHQLISKPPKSKNYSAITAMDISAIIGVKIVRGGVKGPDFYLFIKELIEFQSARFRTRKVLLLMDNASIHKSKDYMQKLINYYCILYNAPYTPQFNPIEFAFSKIKGIVRKLKPKTEQDLVCKILEACKQISKVDAAEYIVHSLKFLEKAINNEDFF